MNLKKAIIAITVLALLGGSVAGCSANTQDVDSVSSSATETSSTQTDKENSTEIETETVTSTEGTTDETSQSTSASTSNSSTSQTTKKQTTATTKKASTTKKSTTANKKTTTKKQTTSQNQSTTVSTTAEQEITINLTKNGNAQCSSSNVTIDAPSGLETQGTVYIEKGGDYIITSDTDTWHGQIVIKLQNTESANIRFENVNISTTKPNAIKIIDASINAERSFIEADASTPGTSTDTDNTLRDEMKDVSKNDKAPNVDLSFPTGTSSSFTTNANALSGVIYNESKLTIKGNGKVDVSATTNRNNAICSTKSITFKNVTANLTTAANNSTSSLSSARGIFTFSKVNIESGSLNIKTNGDGIRCEEYNSTGGSTTITSSASDGIDADDAIIITDGTVKVIALKKSSFKVRRVNNQELINNGDKNVKADDGIKKADHTFKIDGGTVWAESKNITNLSSQKAGQSVSKQASITCRSVKVKGSDTAKDLITFNISGNGLSVTSENKCIKFLYSSPSINTSKTYTVSAKNYDSETVTFNATVGDARIETAKTKNK